MTRIFSLLIFALPFSGKSQHYIGLEAGFLASNVIFQPKVVDYQIHAGFNGGIQYNYQGSKGLTIHSGLRTQQYGHDYHAVFSIQSSGIIKEGRIQYRFMSINVPLRFGYQFGDKIRITPNAGVSMNYILSANSVLPKSLTGFGSLAKSTTFLNEVNSFALSAVVSTELSFNMKENEFFTSIEYQHGLTNIFKEELTPPESSQKHLMLGLTVGFRIPILQKVEDTAPYIKPEDLD